MNRSKTLNTYDSKFGLIVSFDDEKTWIEKINNKIVFCKKSTQKEKETLLNIRELLSDKNVYINNKKYDLRVPGIIKYNNNVLYLEYCNGKNLEFILRDEESHKYGVLILNKLLNFFVENKIYWMDFAPRNILLDNNNIYFVDFEKGLANSNIELRKYYRDQVYEEYCLFLFKNERKINMDYVFEILEEELHEQIEVSLIKSLRIKEVARSFGYNKFISKKDYLNIIKKIIEVEEPKIINRKFIFPGVELDRILTINSKTNVHDYVNEIIKRCNKLQKEKNQKKKYD